MSFIGTVGVVAQQGNQGGASGAPTAVSIATSSSGDYDLAVIILSPDNDGSGNEWIDENGANNNGAGGMGVDVPSNYYQGALANALGELRMNVKCYLRATGATSYNTEMDSVDITNINSSNYNAITISSSTDTDQDNTGGNGIDSRLNLAHPSGGRGFLMPDNGDYLDLTIVGTATNSSGSTDATDIVARLTWT